MLSNHRSEGSLFVSLRIPIIVVGLVLIATGVVSLLDRDPDPVDRSCESGSGLSCLVVQQKFKDGLYTEGSVSYVRVTGGGEEILRELEGPGTTLRVASVAIEPGSYEVASFQRPCMAACPPDGTLDPASDECAASFTVEPGAQVTAKIDVTPGAGCTISLEG